jgi:RNA polymerase sigma-70 factor (ECF subfamily)
MIAEGQELVRRCLRLGQPGAYQIQAAINAVHSAAPSTQETDWAQILALYDQLLVVSPGPVVRLNRAVVVAELSGPAEALAQVDRLDLAGCHLFHAIRADLLRRLDRLLEASEAYRTALACTHNEGERSFLERSIRSIEARPSS